jgi:hypothetical protein
MTGGRIKAAGQSGLGQLSCPDASDSAFFARSEERLR